MWHIFADSQSFLAESQADGKYSASQQPGCKPMKKRWRGGKRIVE
jgi:hypothetical protein